MTADLVGVEFTSSYEVSRAKVREFATAVGETSSISRDVDAARAAGYADLVATPTFAVIPAFVGMHEVMDRLGAQSHQMVHGEQSFTHHRPVVAGDVVTTTAVAERIREVRGSLFVTVSCRIRDAEGEPVADARSMVVVRGEDA